nr:reverse transcriptase domain-containing protein [Tanacetum cinerariifolium]
MADQRTMVELLQAPTEGYEDAIVVPAILAKTFKLKHGLASSKQNPDSNFRKTVEDSCVTYGGPHPYYNCTATDGNAFKGNIQEYVLAAAINTASSLGLGSLPSNIIANPRGDLKAITTRGGVAYDRPMIPPTPLPKEVERETKVTKDKVQNTSLGSTTHVQPPVVQVPIPKPDVAPKPNPKPSIPYPSRLNKQKLHEKDDRLESCMALSDIGASIKLIPLSVWKKLSLPDLTSTRMTLELATRTFAHPARIAEDVFVQVGKFTFSADFVVVDYNVDPRVPLILGRPFLRMACALVNINMINFIEITCEDHFPKVLKFKKSNHPSSGSTTLFSDSSPSLTPFETSDSLLEEFTDELDFLDPIPLGKEDNNFDFEADLREAKFLLHQDPSSESNIETVDPILKKFTDEPALAYLPPSGDDDDDDDLFDLKSDNDG